MTIEHIPRRRCDRPNCNATVTDSHGLIGATLTVDGVLSANDTTVLKALPFVPPDFCRACKTSLLTWWTSYERAPAKAKADAAAGQTSLDAGDVVDVERCNEPGCHRGGTHAVDGRWLCGEHGIGEVRHG